MMRKLLVAAAVCMMFTVSCRQSLEERAAADAEEFTRKNCPLNIAENIVQDSMTFDASSRTIAYHYTLSGSLDNALYLKQHAAEYESHFRQGVSTMPELRAYADEGFNFRYVYRSSESKKILLDIIVNDQHRRNR